MNKAITVAATAAACLLYVSCPIGNHPDGLHAWWPTLRFRWPLGLLFPSVKRCLYCGQRGTE